MARVLDKGNVGLHLSELRVLRRLKTDLHRVVIYRHPHLGRVLVLDDEIQHVEAWAPLYHEPLVHLPAAFVKNPRTALLFGGGSLFAARELLKYGSITRVLMIDHDRALVDEICQVYEHASTVRKDPRLEIRVADALTALNNLSERFDMVINDSIDLFRSGEGSFHSMFRMLRPRGVCSDVVYRHVFEDLCLNKTASLLMKHYRTAFSLVFIPEYPGILHILTLWGKSDLISQTRRSTANSEQALWVASPATNPCNYFDPRYLAYYLYLPRQIRKLLSLQNSHECPSKA